MSKFKDKKDPTRDQQETDEKLKSAVNTEAPETRFQVDQQITKVGDAEKTVVDSEGFSPKKSKAKGSALKQEVAASVILDGKSSGSPSSTVSDVQRAGLKTLSYSGDAGTILGSAAGTPTMNDPIRGKTRFDKKLDEVNKKINFIASEQVLVEYDAPKPLADNESTQGYNGTPKNISARSQKNNGYSPAELLFDRSVDEIGRDELFFSAGQVVKEAGVNYEDTPTLTTKISDAGVVSYEPFSMPRGNYVPRSIKVSFTKDNYGTFVSGFSVTTDDISCNNETADVVNMAADNEVIDMNMAEIARQNIDSKAGRETQLNWSPLGRAVRQPTQTVGYLRDQELMLGAEYFAAYKAANAQLAYQLNKAAKDGQDTVGPMNEMLLGLIANHSDSAAFESDGIYNNPFSPSAYKAGSASLLIALYDSTAKYRTKADVLTQARSLKMHIQTADNNMDVFRLKPEFASALNAHDVFSTIDREYDPTAPILLLDNYKIVHPYDWSKQFGYTQARDEDTNAVVRTWTSSVFQYFYANRSSRYAVKVTNPLLAGMAYYLEQHAGEIFRLLAGTSNPSNGTQNLVIPVTHSKRYFSLYDFLVLAATPYVQYERTNAMRDVLDFEVNFEYPFEQLIDIGHANPMNSVNYTMEAYSKPLVVKEMLPSTAVTWMLPEIYWAATNATGKNANRVMPWYFSEEQYNFSNPDSSSNVAKTVSLESKSGVMSIPVIRSGVRMAYLDDYYGMEERDLRLCLDRMVRDPFIGQSDFGGGFVYKYSQNAEGVPGFVGPRATYLALASVPRELGFFMVAPGSFVRSNPTLPSNPTTPVYHDGSTPSAYAGELDTSYRIRAYHAKYKKTAPNSILDPAAINVDRAQAFTQVWKEAQAIGNDSTDIGVGPLYLSATESMSPFTNGIVSFDVQNGTNAQTKVAYNVNTIHRGLWTRIQKLPFIVSPFETASGAAFDPFDLAILLNFVGFMSSDYNEDIYNRLNQKQNQGWLYTSSPFVQDSPIFKDAAKYTQV